MTLDSYSFTCEGGRSYNEDSVGVAERGDNAVYLVADGLGGHLHGEVASKCVVDTFLAAEMTGEDDPTQWLETQIEQANANILKLQEEQRGSMKSTVVALRLRGKKAAWANVGDSRLYFLHRRALAQYTEDHSVAYKKFKTGEITREQIPTDEDQPSLLRALGNSGRHAPQKYDPVESIEPGDGFFLCSDGMWEFLLDQEILVDFLKADSAQTWGELLQLRAMERIKGGNDNLSLITVMVQD